MEALVYPLFPRYQGAFPGRKGTGAVPLNPASVPLNPASVPLNPVKSHARLRVRTRARDGVTMSIHTIGRRRGSIHNPGKMKATCAGSGRERLGANRLVPGYKPAPDEGGLFGLGRDCFRFAEDRVRPLKTG
jgi:hypothetical protein